LGLVELANVEARHSQRSEESWQDQSNTQMDEKEMKLRKKNAGRRW
jgi:hypothetical protein